MQSTLTVIGRRNTAHDRQRINSDNANLTFADFTDAKPRPSLPGAAELRYAILVRADLSRAVLLDMDLTQAIFSGAKLTGALLSLAKVHEEILKAADLTGAGLWRASYPRMRNYPEGWIRGPLDRHYLRLRRSH